MSDFKEQAFERALKKTMEMVRAKFEESGAVPPSAMVCGPGGVTSIALENIEPKALRGFLLDVCKQEDAFAIIQIAEAWAVNAEQRPGETGEETLRRLQSQGRPSESPERIEMLLIKWEAWRRQGIIMAQIERAADGNATLGEWQRPPESATIEGRISSLLPGATGS